MKTLKLTFACLFLAATICPAAEDPPADHVKQMKSLQAQMGAIRKGTDVAKNAADMSETMKAVSAFWEARHSEVASKARDRKSVV